MIDLSDRLENLNDSDSQRWAVGISLGVHLLAFLVWWPTTHTEKTPAKYRIPVHMVVTQAPIAPTKTVKRRAKSRTLVTKKNLAKAKVVPKKPAAMPGDRLMPIRTDKVVPVYPKAALNNDWEGTVVIKVLVAADGTVSRVKLVRSSGHTVLDKTFIRSVKTFYTFKPKRFAGKNTGEWLELAHSYKLE
ncbi:TonB family protein [bacterium]|jgi:periplasmic protein TonB|nr:TonB family protein [bacterium]